MKLDRKSRVAPRFVALVIFGAMVLTAPIAAIAIGQSKSFSDLASVRLNLDAGDHDGLVRSSASEASNAASEFGERVEDLSKRTETEQVFANPDGTSTLEMSAGVRRVKGDDGKWRDLDLDIVKNDDGSYAPKVASSDVMIGGGGSKEAVRLNLGGDKSLSLSWPTVLPEPTIDGGVATYAINDSTDLLVITTRTGVATRIRLNEKPADIADLSLVVRSEGVDVETTSDGALEINDGDKLVASTEPMTAWDAQSTEGGDPINVVPVEPSLDEISSTGDVERQELTLTTPTDFLDDPETEYPVVVDPDLNNVWISNDTMVRDGVTTSMGSDSRLWAGRLAEDSSGKAYRSFIKWKDDQLLGKDIVAATMGFYQYDAGRCTDSLMYVHALDAAFTNAGTTWANQPAIRSSTSHSISFYQQKGNESCGGTNGWVTGNATNMVSDWANGPTYGGYVNHGVRMNIPGANEPDATYSRRFCSSNEDAAHTSCNTTTRDPYLNITYNTYPDNAPVIHTKGSSKSPDLSATVSDADGGDVRARFLVKQGSATIFDGYSDYVTSGSEATKQLDLPDGTYTVQAWANDGLLSSRTGSSAVTFTASSVAVADESPEEEYSPLPQTLFTSGSPGSLTFAPVIPNGYTLSLETATGYVLLKNSANTVVGHFEAVAMDSAYVNLAGSLAVNGTSITQSITRPATTVYPVVALPVYEPIG